MYEEISASIYEAEDYPMVKIQGKDVNDATGLTISEYLESAGYKRAQVAVECNGEIIPKSCFETKVIEDGEIIEIVSFVGGG